MAGSALSPAEGRPTVQEAEGATGEEGAAGDAAGDAAGTGRVLGARLEARVPEARPGSDPGADPGMEPAPGGGASSGRGGSPSTTRVDLRIRVVADGVTRRIPIRGVALLGVEPTDLRVDVPGATLRPPLRVVRGPLRTAEVELPAALAEGDTLELDLSYGLPTAIPPGEGPFDLVLPLLSVDWPPAGAPEDLLRVRVSIPAEYSVQESFPTVPKEITTSGADRHHDFQVQAIPTLLRFRGQRGEPPLLTFGRLVDLGVLGLLAVAAALGWVGLRRERARAAAAAAGDPPGPAPDGGRDRGDSGRNDPAPRGGGGSAG